jgi:hypothetical protein
VVNSMFAALIVGACDPAEPHLAPPTCDSEAFREGAPPEASEPLFGSPSAGTGLDADACAPACGCGPDAPTYTPDDIEALLGLTLDDPPGPLDVDPYAVPPEPQEAGVCAVVRLEPSRYRLTTVASPSDAAAAGALVTHDGQCGLCSTLQDLAVYLANPDLTEPVRACGISGVLGGEETHLGCLEALGFTRPCAQIWRYNTLNTMAECLDVCVAALDAPYHAPDGALNPCLQCDEEHSGPVFKAVAGRTRRNSGIPSALCRPCETVFPVIHQY